MTVTILTGDCRDILKTMPDNSVHCVITSPPYWGLRDYGTAIWEGGDSACAHSVGHQVEDNKAPGAITIGQRPGVDSSQCRLCGARRIDSQLGLEPRLADYVAGMVEVFREVRRVLRKDGALWLNLGDSYATSVNGRSAADTKAAGNDDRTFRDKPFSTITTDWKSRVGQSGNKGNPGSDHHFRISDPILKPKDLCGIPWRVAFALQADGWYLRQDIIWSKPNPMPESVRDRCTKAHEYIFLLSKSERYYYDAEAIAEPITASTVERLSQPTLEQQEGSWRVPGKTNGPMRAARARFGTLGGKAEIAYGRLVSGKEYFDLERRNKRSVWEVTTQPFPEAHFATFPPALIEPCILAGCPKGGTVLDPFGGAGTTGLVADRLGRNAVLIELNPAYVEMSRRRIQDDAGMFAQINQGPPQDGYDAQKDIEGSFNEAYRAIRERKAAGGPGWEPK